jgi:hypothetical protein
MKSAVQKLDAAAVRKEFPIDGKIDGWFFRVEEVSNNVYEVCGTDLFGRKISRSGTDHDALLEACIYDARQIGTQTKTA